jgi:hypothetical protein
MVQVFTFDATREGIRMLIKASLGRSILTALLVIRIKSPRAILWDVFSMGCQNSQLQFHAISQRFYRSDTGTVVRHKKEGGKENQCRPTRYLLPNAPEGILDDGYGGQFWVIPR